VSTYLAHFIIQTHFRTILSIGWKWALPLVPYGETFRRHRRYLQQYFAKHRLPDYYFIQRKEAHHMLNDILDDPKNFKSHIER